MFKYALFWTLFGILMFYQFHGCIAEDETTTGSSASGKSASGAATATSTGEYGAACDNSTKACNANKNLSCHTKLDPANNVSFIWSKCMCKPVYYLRKNNECTQSNFTMLPPDPAGAYGFLPTLPIHQLFILSVLAFLTTSLVF